MIYYKMRYTVFGHALDVFQKDGGSSMHIFPKSFGAKALAMSRMKVKKESETSEESQSSEAMSVDTDDF